MPWEVSDGFGRLAINGEYAELASYSPFGGSTPYESRDEAMRDFEETAAGLRDSYEQIAAALSGIVKPGPLVARVVSPCGAVTETAVFDGKRMLRGERWPASMFEDGTI